MGDSGGGSCESALYRNDSSRQLLELGTGPGSLATKKECQWKVTPGCLVLQ